MDEFTQARSISSAARASEFRLGLDDIGRHESEPTLTIPEIRCNYLLYRIIPVTPCSIFENGSHSGLILNQFVQHTK